ncbi:MAG: cupin domain-containing protein [Chloroflexi bacterium]|nr:cupin domain-containing protein [Chloroflexota bacterium]
MSTSSLITVRQTESLLRPIAGDGAQGLSLTRLYQNPQHFTFQLAQIEPGGVSKRHQHPWEQVNWVVSGRGRVETDGGMIPISAGDCVVIPGEVTHAIANPGDVPLLLVAVLGPGA